jgi:type I restriction enzyme S subunit
MRFVPKYFCGKFNLHQRAYALMQHQGDGRFVYHSLDYLQDALAEKAVKSTVLSLRLPIVENFVIGYPSPAEQQKIAECLSSLDELMAAQARKVEALKEHKKGLMQQLFPREGESQPRLRFPEFRDAGEWTQDSIGNVCELLNHRRRPITSSQRTPGPYRYYGASGVVDYVEDYIFDERVVLVGEDGAKWGAFERTAFLVEGKFWVNNHAHVLNPHGVNDVLLENYLTMADLAPFVTGAAPPKLTLGKLKEIPVPIPPDEKEGETIATCLSSLDALITAETQKHEALRTHKRGLMQQLFPSPEEVGA